MKNITLLVLLLLQTFFVCNGQSTAFKDAMNFQTQSSSEETISDILHSTKTQSDDWINENYISAFRVPVGAKVLNYRQFGYGVQLTPLLQSMGFQVTNYNGTGDIPFLLQSESFDLIIMQIHGNPISNGDSIEIADYIANGGKIIMAYFSLDTDSTLKTAFGITNAIDYFEPIPVSVWESEHPIFNTPNSITSLPLGTGGITDDDGDRMEPATGAVALGGFVPTPTVNEAAIILGNNNSTFFHGFSSIEVISSLYINLIENEIQFLFELRQENGTLLACQDFIDGDIFTDSGGSTGDYSVAEDSTIEFVAVPGETVTVTFTSFDLEASTGSDCLDTLTIQGDANGGDGIYSGDSNDGGNGLSCIDATDSNGNPTLGPFTSSIGGSLIFTFNSNSAVQQGGWFAELSLSGSCTPVSDEIIQQDGIFDACVDFDGGEIYTDSGGSFGLYSENESSTIQFCPQSDEAIILDFIYFETELNLDILTIAGSVSSDGTYSGTNSPGTVMSQVGGCLSLTFVSNTTVDMAGWSADVIYSGDCIFTEITQQNAVLSACVDFEGGELYTDSGGTALNYDDDELSSIQFCAEAGETVTMEFILFELEASFDFLSISGSDSSDGTYDGTNSPGVVTSLTGGCLSFIFVSDLGITFPGWVAEITLSSVCSTTGADPIISCMPSTTYNNDIGVCGAEVIFSEPTAIDPEGGTVTIVQTSGLTSGSLFPIGETLIEFTATNDMPPHESASCNFTITVEDDESPILTSPDDHVVMVDSGSEYILPDYFGNGEAVTTDNCTQPVTQYSQTPVPNTLMPIGVHLIMFNSIDEYGNESSGQFELTVDEILGVDDDAIMDKIILYPNPATDRIIITGHKRFQLKNVMIFDVSGKLVQDNEFEIFQTENLIDVSSVISGVYIVQITSKQGIITKRLIIIE